MDDARFDDFSRRLIIAADRRELLRQLAAVSSALAAGFAMPSMETEAGKKQRKRRQRCRKKKNRKLCGKKCVRGTCCPDKRCGSDVFCACTRAIEGDTYCSVNVSLFCTPDMCTNSGDCAASARCIPAFNPGDTCCVPECGTV